MRCSVEWSASAERSLADLWNNAADRAAVAAAADSIDQVLTHDPESKGESRGGVKRVLVVPPLAVYFKADPASRVVTVTSAWRWGK